MDFIYLVDLNSYLSDEELKLNDFYNCSLSNKNILALSNDCYTYILPLEKPNELIPVGVSNSPCLNLAWSDDGQYLILILKNGAVNLFNVKTSLLNTIEFVYSFQINSNDILTIKSFSKLPKLCFNYEKKDSIKLFEKFYYKSFNFLNNYSKFAYNGFLFLTKTGLLHICLTDFNTVKNRFEKFEFDMNLSKLNGLDEQVDESERIKYDLGDFSFESDGSINVILTNHDISTPIHLYKINLKLTQDGSLIEGTSELISSLNITSDSMELKTKILFSSNESAQHILVSLRSNKTNTDEIQVWRPNQLNSNLVSSYEMNASNEQLIKTITCPASLVQLTVPKCSITFKDLVDNRCMNESLYIIASYQNGTCGFIDIINYNQTFSSKIPIKTNSFQTQTNETDLLLSKKIRYTQEYIIKLDQSYSGSIGIGLTNLSRLALVRYPFNKDLNNQQQTSQSYLFNLYEYYLMTGYDYWDLMINTNPKLIDGLIDRLEDKFNNQLANSTQRTYFNRHFQLMYLLYKRSSSYNHFRSQDILSKLIMNRLMSIISFSIQLNLNIDQIKQIFNTNNTTNNTANSTGINSFNLNTLSSNFDMINQSNSNVLNSNSILNQIPLKNNLYDYLSDLLRINTKDLTRLNELKSLSLNDLIQSILNRKNYQLNINQNLKHIFQWILDISLYLITVTTSQKMNHQTTTNSLNKFNIFGSSLLTDIWFMNEIRKAIIFIKLLFVYSSTQQLINIQNSLPVLPLRSSMQKDLLGEIYNLYTKIIYKIIEGGSIYTDESIMDACLNLQAETIIRPIDEMLFNLKYSWLGNVSSLWLKTLQFPVDHLFENEKNKQIYPLFDIIRLIQFSRSVTTKQCIRCGNYTESSKYSNTNNNNNSNNNNNYSKTNCIYIQDSCGEKCICGGYWVLSALQ